MTTVAGFVVPTSDVEPRAEPGDCIAERVMIASAGPLDLTVMSVDGGDSRARETGSEELVLYAVSGSGALYLDGAEHPIEPETGAYLRPGERYELAGRELTLVAFRITAPLPPDDTTGARRVTSHLSEQTAEAATTDRMFRVVHDPASGCASATTFVGYIPTVRAPDHYHLYDEVIYVLDGQGAMHMGGADTALAAGSVINLPARTIHCLENVGTETMRVVATFCPAGSPAAAYYPDGTPAYTSSSHQTEGGLG